MKAFSGDEPLCVQGHESFLRHAHADWHAVPGYTAMAIHVLGAPSERDVRARLRDRGAVVIVVPRRDGPLHRLVQAYDELVHVPARPDALDADRLGELLLVERVPFACIDLPVTIDASPCFDDGDHDGQRLLGYLCQADLVHAPAELREILRLELEQVCRDGDPDGVRLRVDACAFVIGVPLAGLNASAGNPRVRASCRPMK